MKAPGWLEGLGSMEKTSPKGYSGKRTAEGASQPVYGGGGSGHRLKERQKRPQRAGRVQKQSCKGGQEEESGQGG